MQKSFSDNRNREVIIKIEDDYISFYYADSFRHMEQYLELIGEEAANELSKEEKTVYDFYYIPKEQWINDRNKPLERGNNWHHHMKEKNWFTDAMYNFLETIK